jgi:hypothetical protein
LRASWWGDFLCHPILSEKSLYNGCFEKEAPDVLDKAFADNHSGDIRVVVRSLVFLPEYRKALPISREQVVGRSFSLSTAYARYDRYNPGLENLAYGCSGFYFGFPYFERLC